MSKTTSDAGLTVAGIPGCRAAIFDYNGTITSADDEETQYEAYAQAFREVAGVRLDRYEYLSRLAPQPDPVIIAVVLRANRIPVTREITARIADRRVALYLARVRCSPSLRTRLGYNG
jgi:beta-phosphoglucomutase-like phosphatase (HAD superfamily)